MNRKRKHHFIPRFYLEAFCGLDNKIYVYDKFDKIAPYSLKPEQAAYENDFYLIEGSNKLEDIIAEEIETPAAPFFKDIINFSVPSFEGHQRLSVFFGFLLVRTPKYRTHHESQINSEINIIAKTIANSENFENDFVEFQQIHGVEKGENAKEFQENLKKTEFEITKAYSFECLLKIFDPIAANLADMKWTLVKATMPDFFLTSDNPVVISNPLNTGLLTVRILEPKTEIIIPISNFIAIILSKKNDSEKPMEYEKKENCPSLVKMINEKIIMNSNKYIYASRKSKEITKYIKKILKH